MKVVINTGTGKFELSFAAKIRMYDNGLKRDDLILSLEEHVPNKHLRDKYLRLWADYCCAQWRRTKNLLCLSPDRTMVLDYSKVERDNPILVETVEFLGEKSSVDRCSLKVIEIPDGVKYDIVAVANKESIIERHRIWS